MAIIAKLTAGITNLIVSLGFKDMNALLLQLEIANIVKAKLIIRISTLHSKDLSSVSVLLIEIIIESLGIYSLKIAYTFA